MTQVHLTLRPLCPEDRDAFLQEWPTFEPYLEDQTSGRRSVIVAEVEEGLAGYVTLLWEADDLAFRHGGVPEISDLRVLPDLRRRGIGTALLDEVEALAATRVGVVGLNVGLHSGYGAAQRLYAKRGYIPDGHGVVVDGVSVPEGTTIALDDDPIVTLRMTKALATPSDGRRS